MKKSLYFMGFMLLFIWGCTSQITKYGQHYQKYQDYESLVKVFELTEKDIDTSYVKNLLGEPIDMGFDYRYLIDSTGENGCVLGVVFHIGDNGKIDQRWFGEICE